jgi:hypothetical protein
MKCSASTIGVVPQNSFITITQSIANEAPQYFLDLPEVTELITGVEGAVQASLYASELDVRGSNSEDSIITFDLNVTTGGTVATRHDMSIASLLAPSDATQ